jgi:hypothetical protein
VRVYDAYYSRRTIRIQIEWVCLAVSPAQQAHAADRLIEGLIVAGLGFAVLRFTSGATAEPGGG